MIYNKYICIILCYNAEKTIENFLNRLFNINFDRHIDFLVLDDFSNDNTSKIVDAYLKKNNLPNLNYEQNKKNLGFGGNLKKAYDLAIGGNYRYLSILHGDGQYPPEYLNEMFLRLSKSNLVLGSRMINKKDALKGKMPLVRFLGNIFLTNFQNLFFKQNLSEWHTGFRGLDLEVLKKIPYSLNSDYFHIDTQILLQFIMRQKKITEFPIPTFYGQEKSSVNLIKYGLSIILEMFLAKLTSLNVIKVKRYEIKND